jgi:hypothetical protein
MDYAALITTILAILIALPTTVAPTYQLIKQWRSSKNEIDEDKVIADSLRLPARGGWDKKAERRSILKQRVDKTLTKDK